MKDISHGEIMYRVLTADPAYATELIADIQRDGAPAELAILLQYMEVSLSQSGLVSSLPVIEDE